MLHKTILRQLIKDSYNYYIDIENISQLTKITNSIEEDFKLLINNDSYNKIFLKIKNNLAHANEYFKGKVYSISIFKNEDNYIFIRNNKKVIISNDINLFNEYFENPLNGKKENSDTNKLISKETIEKVIKKFIGY